MKNIILADGKEFRTSYRIFLGNRDTVFIETSEARQVLDVLQSPNSIDLLILEENLPDMGGTELVKMLRKNGANVPVIMSTNKKMDPVSLADLGIKYHNKKTESLADLRTKVNSYLS